MKNYITILLCLIFAFSMQGQNGGMRVFVGTTSLVNSDIIANPKDHSHSGYHIGADGRLMSGGMAFLVGVKYTNVSTLALEEFKLTGHDSNLSIMNGRVGLDISIISISNLLRIRTKALGSFDIVLSHENPELLPPGYKLNDGWLGFVTGLGADIGPAIVDIEYEIGVINGYNKKKESTFNSLTLSVGFFF